MDHFSCVAILKYLADTYAWCPFDTHNHFFYFSPIIGILMLVDIVNSFFVCGNLV